MLPFDRNDGAGFWWANSLNTFTRNVACENDRYGFRYEATPTQPLQARRCRVQQPDGTQQADRHPHAAVRPLRGQRGAHSDGLYGVNLGEGVNRVGPDARHPFVVRNTEDLGRALRLPPAGRRRCWSRTCTSTSAAYGIYHPNYDHHVYRNVTISQTNTEPFNRGHDDHSVQYGVLTVDGLTFDGMPLAAACR